ncbi:MAG: hypothetical protein PUC93_04580 [Oscillospiraceae bacterium]|nr:hypothetical protein [Oscillospiraceae bacterium]
MNDFYDQAFRHNQPIPSLRTCGTAHPEGQKASLHKPFPVARRKELHDAILDLCITDFPEGNQGTLFFVHAMFPLRLLRTPWYSTLFFYYIYKGQRFAIIFLILRKKRTP